MQLSTNCDYSTIFKQLPTIISGINQLGEATNKLKAINFSVVGLNTGNIDAYRNAISGISKEQATLLLSTQGLNQAQIDLVLSNEKVTATEIAEASVLDNVAKKKSLLTAEQQKQLISSNAITSEKLAEISATLGLETAENGSLVSKKALNAEMVKQQLQSIGIVGSTQTQIMSMLGLTTAETSAATASNILSGAMAKLSLAMSTNPIGALITVIGVAIASVYGLTKAFDALTDSAEEIDERVDSLISKYNDLKTTADNNASTIESLADEYESLSKGVNDLGENISLTSDEYDRYNEIVNQIADMFPTLITGYTDEGTAILSLKGNVEQLRGAYKEAQQEAYNLLVATGKDSDGNDIMESYKNLSELDWWDSSIGAEDVTTTVKRDITKQILDLMSNMDTAVDEYDKLAQYIFDTYGDKGYNFLEEMGLPAIKDVFSDTSGITKEALIAGKATVQSYYQGFQSEINTKLSNVKLMANAFLNTNDFYLDESTSSELKNALSVIVNSLDEELANSFNGEKEKVGAYVNNIVNGIKDNEDAKKALTELFTLDTTDMSVNDIQSNVDSYISTIATTIGEDPVELKVRLGFDDTDTQPLIENVKKKLKGTEFDNKVGELTLEDLEIAADLDVGDDTIQSWDELIERIEKVKSETFNNETDNSFTTILSHVEALSNGLDQLDKIYADVFDKGDFDWSSILNNKEFEQTFGKLGQVYEYFIETVSNSPNDISACQAAFDNLATAYVYSSDILKNVTSETRNATIAMLEQMGIANAQEIVDSKLANTEQLLANAKANLSEICKTLSNSVNSEQEAKYLAKLQSIDLENATYEEIQSLIDEANILGISCNSLIKYKLEKMNANNATINTSDDINNLLSLASAAGIASSAVSKLAGLKARYDDAVKRNLNGDVGAGYEAVAIANQMENAAKEVQNEVLNFKPVVNYGGVSETRKAIDDAAKATKDAADKVKEAVAETFDFIENGINLFEKNLSKIEDRANNTGKSFKSRAKAYEEALRGVSFGMALLSDDYNKYMAKANSIGLDESIAQKVRGGDSNIWDYTDDNLKQQIKDYQTWYNKAQDCLDKIEELKQKQVELSQQSIELIITQYEKYSTKVENANSRMEKWISLKESWGFSGNTDNYNSMNKNIQKQIGYVIQQDELLKKLQKTVTKGSEAWYEYNERIDANKSTLYELKEQMVENAKAAAELAKATADKKVDKYSQKDELYDAKIDNATSAKSKNNLINKKISNINNTQKAYDDAVSTDTTNLKKAKKTLNKFKTTKENKSVLSEIKKKIKAGKRIPQSLLKKASKLNDNGKLYKACVDYNAYFDAKETDKQIADLYKETSKQEKANLAQEKFDNIASEYDYGISGNEQKKTSINNKISLAETQGKRVSTAYYDGLISAESAEQQKLIQKRDALQKSLNEAVINGYIEEGSEEWYAMVDAINEVTNSIDESTKSLVEFHNQQRQIKWDAFDDALETVGRINSESDYYINLMSNKDMVDKDSGKFTEYGTATLGLHQTNYESYLAQAEAYQNEYNSLMDKIARGEESITDENVIKRLRELQDGHRNAKLAAEDELQACQNLIKQGYETQLDILSKLIDKYKKLKDSELESYKYQKEIAEKTKNIAALQKQLSVYGNNDTEESRAQIQKLKLELQNAQDDLKDTEYEKFISDTETMLDDLFNDYEAFIDDKINNTDTLLTDIKGLLGDEGSIVATLKALDPNLTQTLENTVNGNTNAQDYTNNEVANEQNNAEQPVDNSGYDAEAEAKKQAEEAQKEKERQENERKRNMLLSQIKIVQDDITEMEKELQRLAEEEEEYKNAKKDKKNKGKVFVKRDWASLRKTINGRLATREQELEDLNSQLASIPQYEKGSSHISKKQLAWTQENGSEMIYRASDGAMLTPLGTGDKVFTNEMSERFWKLAQMNPVPLNIPNNIPTPLPVLERNTDTVGDVNIDLGGITMYGVNDPETFGRQLREEICKNGRTTQCVAEAVSAKQLGKSGVGNARMYK